MPALAASSTGNAAAEFAKKLLLLACDQKTDDVEAILKSAWRVAGFWIDVAFEIKQFAKAITKHDGGSDSTRNHHEPAPSLSSGDHGAQVGAASQTEHDMVWSAELTRLRNALAGLYPDVASARSLLDVAGIPAARISFHSAAQQNWHAILAEVRHHRKLASVCRAALLDYPDHDELKACLAQIEPHLEQTDASMAHGHPTSTTTRDLPATVDLAIVAAMPEELEPVLELIGGRAAWREFSSITLSIITACSTAGAV